jgi:hypothetical protein
MFPEDVLTSFLSLFINFKINKQRESDTKHEIKKRGKTREALVTRSAPLSLQASEFAWLQRFLTLA